MRFLNWLFNLNLMKDYAKVSALLEVEQKKNSDLLLQVQQLEDEKRELLDWVLENSGAPTLYGRNSRPAAPPIQGNQHEQRMRSSRTMRDWVRAAEEIEAQAGQFAR